MIECKVDGCHNDVKKRTGVMLCEKHYARLRRTGKTGLTDRSKNIREHSQGYLIERNATHPLSSGSGCVYQHRRILYDSNPKLECHHCGVNLVWERIEVDHLDRDKKNNSLDNIVVSCKPCNMKRENSRVKDTHRLKNAIYTYKGDTLCATEWAERIGISRSSFIRRVKTWDDIDRVYTQPRGKFGPTN